jgi:hypothetical protein
MQLLLVDKRNYSTQQETGAARIGSLIKEQTCGRAFVGTVIHCSGEESFRVAAAQAAGIHSLPGMAEISCLV